MKRLLLLIGLGCCLMQAQDVAMEAPSVEAELPSVELKADEASVDVESAQQENMMEFVNNIAQKLQRMKEIETLFAKLTDESRNSMYRLFMLAAGTVGFQKFVKGGARLVLSDSKAQIMANVSVAVPGLLALKEVANYAGNWYVWLKLVQEYNSIGAELAMLDQDSGLIDLVKNQFAS